MPQKAPTARGRPPSKSPLTPNSKKKYQAEKTREHRKRKLSMDDQSASPAAKKSLKMVALSQSEDAPASAGDRKARGRPPLRHDLGPMNEEELAERRRILTKKRNKKQRISLVRSRAVSKRGDRQEDATSDSDESNTGATRDNDDNNTAATRDRDDSNTAATRDRDASNTEATRDSDESNTGATSASDGVDDHESSTRTLRRKWSQFVHILPVSLVSQAELLRSILKQNDLEVKSLSLIDSNITNKTVNSTLYYRKIRVLDFFRNNKRLASLPETFLLKWAQKVCDTDHLLFSQLGLVFVEEQDIPRLSKARILSLKIMTDMRKNMKKDTTRKFNISFVINVAESLIDVTKDYGDAKLLAEVVGCTEKFAARVLKLVESGKTQTLFRKERRRDSIQGSGVFSRFLKFIALQENLRECPGQTISVSKNKRMQQFLLKKSKMEMALQFLEQNSDIKVGPKVLLRDWPQNFKTPSNRDLLRNVCPVHANFRHLLSALHGHGVCPSFITTWTY